MSRATDDILRKLNVPWITQDGCIDLTKIPIESTLKESLGHDLDRFSGACRMLSSMAYAGREDAVVFLYGLLVYYGDDITMKAEVVDALGLVKTHQTAGLLFKELHNTTSSNSTRRYIDCILRALEGFPLESIEEGLEALLSDSKWSYRMKSRFRGILERRRHRFRANDCDQLDLAEDIGGRQDSY